MLLDGLMIVVQPASRDGATLRAITKNGKFHGQMPATTPIGFWNSRMFSRGSSELMISPS